MKKTLISILCIILALSLLSVACSKKKSATGPSATNTAVVVAPTATATTIVCNSLFCFTTAADLTSWPATGGFSGEVWNNTSVDASGGTGCLQVTGTFAAAGNANGLIQDVLTAGTDFTGKTISVWINCPASLVNTTNPYGVQIFVQDTTYAGNYCWNNITAAGWQQYSMAVTTGGCGGSANITAIKQIGIQVGEGAGSPDISGVTILFDNINW